MKFAEKIRNRCKELNWNAADLAKRCQISPTTAGYYLNDDRLPFRDKFPLMVKELGLPADYLIDDSIETVDGFGISPDEQSLLKTARLLKGGIQEAMQRILNYREDTPPHGGLIVGQPVPAEIPLPRRNLKGKDPIPGRE